MIKKLILLLAVCALACASAPAEPEDWVAGFAGTPVEEAEVKEAEVKATGAGLDALCESLAEAAKVRNESWTGVYSDDFDVDNDIEKLWLVLFENGAESFTRSISTLERTVSITDIEYRRDMTGSVWEAAEYGTGTFVLSAASAFDSPELFAEMMVNAGYTGYDISYWADYGQVLIENAEMRPGIYMYTALETGNEDRLTEDMKLMLDEVRKLASGVGGTAQKELEADVNAFVCEYLVKAEHYDGWDNTCDAYADLFYCAAKAVGLECGYVYGTANNEARMLNRVKIDGNWYIADPYANDLDMEDTYNTKSIVKDMVSMAYLNVSDGYGVNAAALEAEISDASADAVCYVIYSSVDEAIEEIANEKISFDSGKSQYNCVCRVAVTGNCRKADLDNKLTNKLVEKKHGQSHKYGWNLTYIASLDITCVDVVIFF